MFREASVAGAVAGKPLLQLEEAVPSLAPDKRSIEDVFTIESESTPKHHPAHVASAGVLSTTTEEFHVSISSSPDVESESENVALLAYDVASYLFSKRKNPSADTVPENGNVIELLALRSEKCDVPSA